ncbi:hypothetical protein PHMEG_00018510 [Phytophthora megakarya]|uniref:Uncharacterized protein n=1 Tax=Phytophthora megakarya TaxID=4795 RepID=A0A225VVF4_9STRA|nr:hypothetical protein PHMEG_00018510 [Phytophthora megakarya]
MLFPVLSGRLDMVQCIYTNFKKGAMDSAAANGHLTVIRWLHDHGFVCSTNTIDLAATNDHKDVVCWLYSNTPVGCTESAMDRAAIQGHFSVLVYLRESCNAACSPTASSGAAEFGRLAILRRLRLHYPHSFKSPYARTHALLYGWLADIIQLLCGF